ncbi:MAG: hypothetical protein ABIJ18_01550 [archaeon]
MNKETFNKYEEQKKLVLARLNTLNPESKIMLGSSKKVSVKELITHVESGDPFGKKVILAQMHMLKVLAGSA